MSRRHVYDPDTQRWRVIGEHGEAHGRGRPPGYEPPEFLLTQARAETHPPHGWERSGFTHAEYLGLGADEWERQLVSGKLQSPFARNVLNQPENPDHEYIDDEAFQVLIAASGGLDSTTMERMAQLSGTPYRLVYVDMGQPNAAAELAVIEATSSAPIEVLEIDGLPFKHFGTISVGRNAVILHRIAATMRDLGWWGEVWMGNVAGESEAHGGDKSNRFFADMQHLLSRQGFDTRICNPLATLDKADIVAYWQALGDVDTARATKSCMEPHTHSCGRCGICFRRWVAFRACGIDVSDQHDEPDPRVGFAEMVERYMVEAPWEWPEARFGARRAGTLRDALEALA